MVKRMVLLAGTLFFFFNKMRAQTASCQFKPPFATIHFGTGAVYDANSSSLFQYSRVSSACPTDGHYSYVASTAGCFRGDWHTLAEDHTPGDAGGNMLLVNSAYSEGVVLTTRIKGFKSETTYQFGVWLMNVCRPSDKCPFPLLPNLSIRLQTTTGNTVAFFSTGELTRRESPQWTQHRAQFTVPSSVSELILTLRNEAPGGCGNDFALDDITFQECIKPDPARVVETNKKPSFVAAKKQTPVKKQENKKKPLSSAGKNKATVTVARVQPGLSLNHRHEEKPVAAAIPTPLVLKNRANPLVGRIEAEEGEVLLQLYDNGEIDGDTVSIYHNNRLIVSGQRLSQKPITIRLKVDPSQPRHELVMVAENLGSIPPNTSLMLVTTKQKRHQVFISSTEQKNARVIIELKE